MHRGCSAVFWRLHPGFMVALWEKWEDGMIQYLQSVESGAWCSAVTFCVRFSNVILHQSYLFAFIKVNCLELI